MKYELLVSDTGQRTLDALTAQGLVIPTGTDVVMPKLPADITFLSNEELMELFTQLTAFLEFVSYQLSLAEIDEKATNRQLDAVTAAVTIRQPKNLAAVVKAAAMADPDVIAASEKAEVAYNYRKLIQTMSENINRGITLVSRELTRRTSDGHVMSRTRKFIT